jgi:serine/threonine-protein kinase HipA
MPVRGKPSALGIYLRPNKDSSVRVGSLYRDPNGAITFTVDQKYIALGPRVPSSPWRGAGRRRTGAKEAKLGCSTTETRSRREQSCRPSSKTCCRKASCLDWFKKEFGAGAFENFDVLSRLGGDLPGAVLAILEAGEPPPAPPEVEGDDRDDLVEKIHFSLAGIQLKFSMKQNDKGSLALPMSGVAGDLILKTPSEKHFRFPEAEFTALELARAVGIRTVDGRLVTAKEIEGIDEKYLAGGDVSLLVTRFDRAADERRIHIEDFAQVMGSIHDQKYVMANQSPLVKLVGLFASDERGEMLQAIRRVVVEIMVGNGDSHLKNWSFIFPDGRTPELSPAYDIVPTFYYGDDRMALQFGKTLDPAVVNLRRFQRLAGLADLDIDLVLREVKLTMEEIFDVWPGLLPQLPTPPDFAKKLVERWDRLTLVKEVRPAVVQGRSIAEQEGPSAVPTPR